MADNDELAKEFEEAFNNNEHKPTPEETPEKTPETPDSPEDPKAEEKAEEPETKEPASDKDDEGKGPKKPEGEEAESPAPTEKEDETDGKEAEPAPPLTKDHIKEAIADFRNEERTSTREAEEATNEVLEAYYPEGVSNVLIDEQSGKELRSPQDVVDASGGKMSIEEAAQWLTNEQFKLDKNVSEIKSKASKIAETSLNFKKGVDTALTKYEPLFKEYPHLQQKVWDALKKQVQTDKDGKFVLAAPDALDFYDLVLEPYRLAFEHKNQQSATANTPEPEKPEPPKPTAEDRMDVTGDGGSSEPLADDDFAGHVRKELANPN